MDVKLNTQYVSADGRLLFAKLENRCGLETFVIYQLKRTGHGTFEKIEVATHLSENKIKTALYLEVNQKSGV